VSEPDNAETEKPLIWLLDVAEGSTKWVLDNMELANLTFRCEWGILDINNVTAGRGASGGAIG
jgi:hypothetical protein